MVVGFESRSAEETRALGRRLAEALEGGEVICLEGPLGAGKTTLVQGLARGLGVRQPVTSPTFVLTSVYPGAHLVLSHLDLYRLSGPSEFTAAGLEDPLWDESVCVIEWAEKVKALLPEDRIWVRMAFEEWFSAGDRANGREGLDPGGFEMERRQILLQATGPHSRAVLSAAGLQFTAAAEPLANGG